jgi:hypothetical protein
MPGTPIPFILSKLCVLAPLREIFRLKSKILIHRDFSFQRNSKPFKAVQRYSKLFTCIIFYFYAPISKIPFGQATLLPTGWSLDLLWSLDVAPKAFGVGTLHEAFRKDTLCQPTPSYASLCQPSPLPRFFWQMAIRDSVRDATGRGLPRRSAAKAGVRDAVTRPHGPKSLKI